MLKSKQPTRPSISVVIPAYNGEQYLPVALAAVLKQSFLPLEIIVVDDGSQDGTASRVEEIARSEPLIRLICQPNGGTQVARNTGIAAAQGDYIALLDQDDRWLPGYLAAMSAHLRPDAIIFSDYQIIDEAGQVITPRVRVRAAQMKLPYILLGNYVFLSGTIFARSLWQATGPFDPGLIGTGDWDWLIRLCLKDVRLQAAPIGQALWQYRLHPSNTTRNVELMTRNMLQVLDKTFQRPGLAEKYPAYQAQAYYLAYVLAAGKYYAIGEPKEARRYLSLARREYPKRFRSLQTFISFLKIYAQTGPADLLETGPAALDFGLADVSEANERHRLAKLGQCALLLLKLRRSPAQVVRQLPVVWSVLFEPGFYATGLAYVGIYLRHLVSRLELLGRVWLDNRAVWGRFR